MRYYQRLPCTNIALIPMRNQQTPENKSRRLHRSDLVCDGTNDFRILIISSCQQDIGVGIGETSFNPPMGNIPRVHQTPPIEALRNFVSSLSVVNYTLRQQPTTHIASNLERPISHSTYMPNINPQHKRVLTTSLRPSCPSCRLTTQIRHASLLRRPKRPYTFTQMITLSDGSTYLHRTTSPTPIYRSTKDTKNNPLWNPSSQKLANVEEDEAGRLKRFRGRFGRGWDAEVVTSAEEVSWMGALCLR